MWKAGNVINRIGSNPPAVLIWDDETGADVGEARTIEAARMMAAAPAMLAALQNIVNGAFASSYDLDDPAQVLAMEQGRAAIAAATGAPIGETAPPVDSDGKRTDTWNLVPGAQPEEDDAALSTYRITETAVYLVKAEDEAHAERRFVCEVGIHADSFHAVEGRTIELVEEGEG